jgi:hypothetical protein
MTKIGILIPSTSRWCNWSTYQESHLYKYTLKTFLKTYDKEHHYIFYIGIDKGDEIYDNEDVKIKFKRFLSVMKNVDIEFIYMDGLAKGHLTVMWNSLFEKSYNDGCDYFFQCGDDIEFNTSGWVNDCIKALLKSKNVGVAGPINNNVRILTQSFVSRKHMELFGYYFPPEIINWCCDDWINEVYKEIKCYYPLQNHLCINAGGPPRYIINNDININQDNLVENTVKMREGCSEIVNRDLERIKSQLILAFIE